MKKAIFTGTLALTLIFLSSVSGAYPVYQGTIFRLGGNPVGEPAGLDLETDKVRTTVTTVDYVYFTVEMGGKVEIDLLSIEVMPDYKTNVDVNDDGEIAFIDPSIYLFRDDGRLDKKDLIGWNDDGGDYTFGDGSVSRFDSFWTGNLESGKYVLAVGDYELTLKSALSGVNPESLGPYGPLLETYDWSVSDHGDFQVTLRGDVTIQPVPEPGTLMLLVGGLCGLASVRSRLIRRNRDHSSRQNL